MRLTNEGREDKKLTKAVRSVSKRVEKLIDFGQMTLPDEDG